MPHLTYFAYGSNMWTPRLRFRVGSARVLGIGTLPGHRLCFHKRSERDGSAKADAFHTGAVADTVRGVLFALSPDALETLHVFEGRGVGYHDHIVAVTQADGTAVDAITYRADPAFIAPDLVPFDWYWAFVRNGAVEHGLPADYVAAFIDSVPHMADPDAARAARSRAEVRPGD